MSNLILSHHKISLTRAIERRFGKSATGYSFSASSERVVKITDTEAGSWVKGEFWQGFRMKVVGEFDGSALPEADKPAAGGAHGFTRGQQVRVRDGYEFSGCTRLGEVVTQMHGAQPAWSVRCEFGGAVHYLRPDGIEAAPAMVEQPCQQPQAQARAHALPRRAVLGALALPLALPVAASAADPVFAAIELCRETERDFLALVAALGSKPTLDAERRADEAGGVNDDAVKALGNVRPTTLAGLHALIRFYAADAEQHETGSVATWALGRLAAAIDPHPPP